MKLRCAESLGDFSQQISIADLAQLYSHVFEFSVFHEIIPKTFKT